MVGDRLVLVIYHVPCRDFDNEMSVVYIDVLDRVDCDASVVVEQQEVMFRDVLGNAAVALERVDEYCMSCVLVVGFCDNFAELLDVHNFDFL